MSFLVIIALSPHPVLICLIFGVITGYEICKVNYVCLSVFMILLLIKYKYVYCFYFLREEHVMWMLVINHYYYYYYYYYY